MAVRLTGGGFRRRGTDSAFSESLEQRVLLAAVAFASPVTTQISSGIFPVVATATGDLNGDGIPDLVAARDNLQAQVFLGAKTGAFTLGPIYASGGNFIALGDFSGDGKLDLATANGIYPGIGNGTFGALVTGFTLPVATVRMYAEDVNGDGKLDLVCVTYTAASGAANSNATIGMSILVGNGNGTFEGAIATTIGSAANLTQADATLAFQDFNGDGKLDVMTPFGLMLGNGDGTFNKPIPLPFKGLAAGAPAIPAAPIFAIGDFNGDGNFDLATLPATGNSGQVEIFLGDGKGNFTDNGPITVAANEAITALDADFLTTGGNTDFIAGISNSPGTQTGTADTAVMVNNGNATFAAPTLYPVSGPPISISAADFNGDGNPDLLSIDAVPGSTTSTGLPLASTAAVLLNIQAALSTPVLTPRTSANPTVHGNPVKYTAIVQPPATAPPGAPVPSGAITFFNGTQAIGAATLVNGKATLTVTASGVGVEQITFTYGGDANYASVTSNALLQTVLQTGAKVPLLLPTLGGITLPPEFLRGDSGNVAVTLTNGGGAIANGKISVNFYLTPSGAIDSSAIAVPYRPLQNRPVQIASGNGLVLNARLKLGSYPPGNYFLVAQVVPVARLTADEVSSTPVVSTTTLQAAGLVFGSVGVHHGLVLKVADASGQRATFSLTGPGTGAITQNGGTTDLTLTGTTTSSHLTIASPGAYTLDNADVRSALNSFTASRTTLNGDLNLNGGVRQLSIASTTTSLSSGAIIRVAGGTVQPALSLGSVGNLTLTSAGPIASLSARTWSSGAIDAMSIASMRITGSFAADVRTHAGGKIKSATIGSITGGIWAVAGGIGLLRVSGSVDSASIYAGADSGPDDTLGTSDDTYSAAAIGTLFIGGSTTSALIAAGVAPAPGGAITSGIILLPKGAIVAITLRGPVSDDSQFLAAHLPKFVKVNGAKAPTVSDPHFQL